MEKIAEPGTALDLLVDGTFALRRALDGLARPVWGEEAGALHLARQGPEEPPVDAEPIEVGAYSRQTARIK